MDATDAVESQGAPEELAVEYLHNEPLEDRTPAIGG
jgi:hypothetical protein